MADWTTISDTQVDPNAPLTSELMTALRDNPIAIAQGASGATRITDAALATGAATTAGTTWVNLRVAGLTAGAVGTFALLYSTAATAAFGTTVAGSSLTPAGLDIADNRSALGSNSGSAQSGTWRCLGYSFTGVFQESNYKGITLWVRIS